MSKIFDWFINIQIINWRKLNIYNFWVGLLFTICHPIEAWRYHRNCIGSTLYRIIEFFTRTLPKYTPFSKACRWLGYMLVNRVYDNKLLDDFYCRTRGANTKYYDAICRFGYIKFFQIEYKRAGKNVNTFFDCFVTTLVDEEQGKKNAEEIKTIKTTLYRGWVFTKKKAFRVYKEFVTSHPEIFNKDGKAYPEVNKWWCMHIIDNMRSTLDKGKLCSREYFMGLQLLEDKFNTATDRIEKLWCYVTDILCLQNDFHAHKQLADICQTCRLYLDHKEMKTRPEIDFTYRQLVENNKTKEAEKWYKHIIKEFPKNKTLIELRKQLDELEKFYRDEPYEYFRI